MDESPRNDKRLFWMNKPGSYKYCAMPKLIGMWHPTCHKLILNFCKHREVSCSQYVHPMSWWCSTYHGPDVSWYGTQLLFDTHTPIGIFMLNFHPDVDLSMECLSQLLPATWGLINYKSYQRAFSLSTWFNIPGSCYTCPPFDHKCNIGDTDALLHIFSLSRMGICACIASDIVYPLPSTLDLFFSTRK